MTEVPVNETPQLGTITRTNGLTGEVTFAVTVSYPGESAQRVQFTGHLDGGPIVLISPLWPEGLFVDDPSRFGRFGPAWVRNFYAAATEATHYFSSDSDACACGGDWVYFEDAEAPRYGCEVQGR